MGVMLEARGRPPDPVLAHWQIAVKGDHAHFICMPHVTRQAIDILIVDIVAAMQRETK